MDDVRRERRTKTAHVQDSRQSSEQNPPGLSFPSAYTIEQKDRDASWRSDMQLFSVFWAETNPSFVC